MAKKTTGKKTPAKKSVKKSGKKSSKKTSKKVAKKTVIKTVKKTASNKTTGKKSVTPKTGKQTNCMPRILKGGNPQIAKAEGDQAVQDYINAIPGWKKDVAKQVDIIISGTIPDVQKAMKWNSPFYGIEDRGWYLNFHCYTKYVKVAFFLGTSLKPEPPVSSKHEDVRYLHIHEDEEVDEKQFIKWLKQSIKLPGWTPWRKGKE